MTFKSDFTPLITPMPDDNTAEAVMFGPAYKFFKSSKWYLDEVEESVELTIEELIGQLEDVEWASYVVNNRPYMIYARNPPVSEPSKIRDLWTLRQIVNYGSTYPMIDLYRATTRLYSTIEGVDQHARQYIEGGVSEDMWRQATLGFTVPVDYETIRTIKDRDELMAASDAEGMYAMLDDEARRQEAERIRDDYRRYGLSFDDDGETEPEDDHDSDSESEEPIEDDEPEIPIYREYEVDSESEPADVLDEDYWNDEPESEPESETEEFVPASPVFDSIAETAWLGTVDTTEPFLQTLGWLAAQRQPESEPKPGIRERILRRREVEA